MMINIDQAINQTRIRKIKRTLKQIISYAAAFETLSDDALKAKTAEFKERLKNGASLDSLLAESYAVVREASRRVLGMYPKEVQLMGAIVLHDGNIAEMQTGEGKTLTATMPLYLNALTGKGAYLITTNDYLATRDYEEMKPLYEWLGLTASLGFVDIPGYEYKKGEKKQLYDADIIYSTNGRIGFDYLINNLADTKEGKFQKPLSFCIIDEVDSIILDAAQTPLVISGAPRVQSNMFNVVKAFIDTLTKTIDYEHDEKKQEVWLLAPGVQAANQYFGLTDLYDAQYTALVRNINLALRAKCLFEMNQDYYIIDGEIVLIDKISGRLLEGTKLQSGLHQSIEAKEMVDISEDMSVLATITFQNLFKQFYKFSGMSATSKLGEKEFFDLYGKVVVQIPTANPIQRIDLDDRVFINKQAKDNAILEKVIDIHKTTRPILLITRTADDAEYFSKALFANQIPNNLLIAQNVAKEAQIISEAGYFNSVTVATSMAGRGTDIKLETGVDALGGLSVIISEHMENSRIDRQLRGRAGRQGDPGSSQIYISLEDYIVQRYSNQTLLHNESLLNAKSEQIEESKVLKRRIKQIVTRAQIVSEEHGTLTRQMNNEFDRSVSVQRLKIYAERDKILDKEQFDTFDFKQLAHDVFTRYVYTERIDSIRALKQYIYKNISFQFEDEIDTSLLTDKERLIDFLVEQFEKSREAKRRQFKDEFFYVHFIQKCMLKAIDSGWIDQVDYLQQLKGNINSRQLGRRNVIFEYHKTALSSYEAMTSEIKRRMVRNICLSIADYDKKGNLIIHFP
ncbi:accessory Sec system translocase SecA2 [Macrococcoides caseolyticum subsp. hominis]|uniref:accessory Sec system translocase SecA2 n=1 Tax=Macrococcoides caseolyticum TaxID=69966 RepID=UPI000C16239E|nr:accessory Sec system translocase SecA2 [Macrococcus caseolyticus]RAI78828.1 accessory Sec system translocase SecA2 [Macrococcus caseolyticus subsp. hominis]